MSGVAYEKACNLHSVALREKCPVISGPYFPVFGLDTFHAVFEIIWRKLNTQINCNSNKCNLYFPVFGLNTGRYGPEITPYFDTFHAVSVIRQKKNLKLVVKRTQSRSKFQENKLLKYFVKYYVLNLTLFPATFSQY